MTEPVDRPTSAPPTNAPPLSAPPTNGVPDERPLSVCLVSTNSGLDNGGTAAYIRYLGNALSRHHKISGVSRRIFTSPRGIAYEESDAPQIVSVGENWQTHMAAPQPVLKPLLRQSVRLITRPALQNIGVNNFVAAYGDSVDAATPAETDIVHYVGNGWELMGFAALASARKRGAAFVVTPFVHPGAWGDSSLDVRLYNEADAVFVCSQYEAQHLEKCGVRHTPLVQIGIAPASDTIGDGDKFRREENVGERPLLLFIGRKQKYKGYHVLCEAMEMVQKSVPDVCLVVIGSDREPPYPPVRAENLRDLGELPVSAAGEQKKADALAACDIFVMPSEAEAFGIVYIEAWAHKKPVVGGPAPAVRELIENGVTGFCVAQNKNELARVLVGLLQNPDEQARMGAAGYARQQKAFIWEAVAAHHTHLYQAALMQKAK